MKETLSLSVVRKLQLLLEGNKINSSAFPARLAEELSEEGILTVIVRGTRKSYLLKDAEGLRSYLGQRYNMNGDLNRWIEIKSREEDVTRGEQVKFTGSSKTRNTRTFKGFLLKCYHPIEATLHGEPYVISSRQGTSVFLEEYEYFRIPEDVTVIGVENGENFQHIYALEYLFKGMNTLFVSRYPQSKDLRNWLQMIPNRYLHFGDFDLAGVHIFLTEYYVALGERAHFFVPQDIEERLKNGNRRLYDQQYARYGNMQITDARLRPLVQLIHQYRRGYEQEGYLCRR